MAETETARGASALPARLPGVLLALFGVLLVGAISQHPAVGPTSPTELLPQIVRLAARDEAVHAVAIVAAVGLLTSLWVFSSRRPRMQSVASAGLIVYSIGIGGTVVAALIDGFLVPSIAARYIDALPARLDAVLPLLQVCALTIQIATKFGLIAMSVAIALWSVTLMNGSARIVGSLGLAGAFVAALVIALTNTLNPHSLGAIVLLQTGWYVWIGILMIRGEL